VGSRPGRVRVCCCRSAGFNKTDGYRTPIEGRTEESLKVKRGSEVLLILTRAVARGNPVSSVRIYDVASLSERANALTKAYRISTIRDFLDKQIVSLKARLNYVLVRDRYNENNSDAASHSFMSRLNEGIHCI
jgi:hypothetical protein